MPAQEFVCENISVRGQHLLFAGHDTTVLAKKYGTPLYLLDEMRIRQNCQRYLRAFQKHFKAGSRPLYASKANSFCQIYRIMQQEGMGIDVVSSGEIYTAVKAGYAMENAYFHGNNKTQADIAYAMEQRVGYFVADSAEEIRAIQAEALLRGIRQKILLRVTPGIDPHTYEAVNTGMVDSKFGVAIETGQAMELVAFTLQQSQIDLIGFHCHVGSQVFAEDVFERASVVMLEFIAAVYTSLGYLAQQLDLGGGYGVRYTQDDPILHIEDKIAEVAAVIHDTCRRLHIEEPSILMEPGRSIIADAGMTLYQVGSVKRIPGYKNYVSVDGGMTDNPRFALYRSCYTCLAADKMEEHCDISCSVVGRCCESGDIIQENVPLPTSICRGDLLAVCTTGAYNFSMASPYNRVPRPPIVMLRDNEDYIAVRRETVADLAALDL